MTLFAQTVNQVLLLDATNIELSSVLALRTIISAHQMAVSLPLLALFPKTLKA